MERVFVCYAGSNWLSNAYTFLHYLAFRRTVRTSHYFFYRTCSWFVCQMPTPVSWLIRLVMLPSRRNWWLFLTSRYAIIVRSSFFWLFTLLKTYLQPVVGQNKGAMERSHGLRYCEWKRTQIIFLFNDNRTTSASYLRVRSTGQSRFRSSVLGFFYYQFFRDIRGKIFKELLSRTAAILHPHTNQYRPMFRNPAKFFSWNPGILVFEFRNPTNDWSPESKFYLDKDYI